MKEKFYTYIKSLQNKITDRIEEIDKLEKFKEDIWKRKEGGGGKTRILQNGKVFEKAGVNISAVNGKLPESIMNYLKSNLKNTTIVLTSNRLSVLSFCDKICVLKSGHLIQQGLHENLIKINGEYRKLFLNQTLFK